MLALLTYMVLAVVATFPLITHLTTHLPAVVQEQGNDVWQNAWNLWWIQQAVLVNPTNPYWSDAVMYPQGASLALHTLNLPLGLLGLPLLGAAGIIPTYNLLTILTLVLAGYTAFLLIRHLTGSAPAALVGGAIVLCSPLRLAELRFAQLPTLSDYGVHLALLALLVALATRTRWAVLLVALAVLLTGLSSWYHLFHLGIVFALLLLWRGVAAWRAGGVPALRHEAVPWLGVAALSALLLLPFVIPVVLEAVTARDFARKGDALVAMTDVARMLPPGVSAIWQPVPHDWQATYLFAWVPLALAAVGVAVRWRAAAPWLLVGAVCLVLSLGPALQVAGVDTGIPLPYAAVRELPVIEVLRAPIRLNAITTLVVALLAAWAVVWASGRARLGGAAQWGVALLLVALVAVEGLRLPITLRDGQLSPWYSAVAEEPGEWSLLELPFGRQDRAMQAMYAQTVHGKLILAAHLSREVPRFPYEDTPRMQALDTGELLPDILPMDDDEWWQLLRSMRVRYLLIHKPDTPPAQQAAQLAVAPQVLGAVTQVYEDDALVVLRVEEMAAWLDAEGSNLAATPDPPLFLGFREPWSRLEYGDEGWNRWLPPTPAGLWTYSKHGEQAMLAVTMYSFPPGERPLEVHLNGERVARYTAPQGLPLRHYISGPLTLPAGPSQIELVAPAGGVAPTDAGSGGDVRPLSFDMYRIRLIEVAR